MESYHKFNNIDRKIAIIAALPLFIFGLLIASIMIFMLAIGNPSSPLKLLDIASGYIWHNSALIVGGISYLVIVYAAILAFKNRLPIWSYTWLSAILVGFLLCLFLVTENQGVVISKAIDISALTLLLVSCLVIFCGVVLKGWQYSGLLSIVFCETFVLALLFFQVFHPILSYICLASILFGSIAAILVYIFLRSHSDTVRIIVIVSLACVNIGISWTIIAITRIYHPSKSINEFWNLAAFLILILLVGTFSGIPGRFIKRKYDLLKRK